jgi:membrane dipeptidase
MTVRFCLGLLLLPLLFSCQSYKELHREAVVIDTHNDVLSGAIMKGLSMEDNLRGKAHSDFARFRQGGVDAQVFSVFCDERFGKDTAFKYANLQIDALEDIARRNPDQMILVKSPAQLQMAIRQGKLGALIGVEGGHMIEDRLENLDALYARGARYLTLTWNNSTAWASSAMDEQGATFMGSARKDTLTHKGLTDFGKQVVRRMNELGMMVDVSHVGEQTFWDVMSTTTKPIIASHSCAHALCPIFRNLTDEQIRAIGKNGGVVFLNFFSGFLDSSFMRRVEQFQQVHKAERDSLKALKWSNYEVADWMAATYPREAEALRPPLSLLMDHLDHVVKLVGVDHVGLGSDFDGVTSTPRGLDDVSSFPLITQALRKRGYNKKQVKKILGENFIRVFRANAPGKPTAAR